MRYLFSLLMVLGFISCDSFSKKDIVSVEITPVFEDSLSIRAISPVDETKVWFAADKGIVGLIDGKTPKLATIKYEDSLLHFRSIAQTKNAFFVLSIANPGVLYKIGYNGNEATNIEEVYLERGEKVFYDAMAFWNDSEGIAMGDPINGCLSIIRTKDGGNTWSKISCDNLPKTEAAEAAFAASNSNISLVGTHVWIVTGGKRARVFHSADKGETWEVFNTPIIQGQAMTGIYSVDFYDENLGVIFGGNWDNKTFNEGNKAITRNGGKTWDLISNGKGPGYRSSVRFIPGTQGESLVAVGSPGISYSPDQGDSWTELSEEGFYALEFVNDSVAFASGQHKISKLVFRK
ncbi:WD40/YVTN/BNR-like repeat-containing protein [Jejudonia soesokkakensis]|uniref:WD40/YVTN/BNR-like repeat-containing protein n=1 Tax=Jejudonia soesokkakensis TaxID=1323432 RepID=A0ABW2MRS5_9FLAO